MRRKNESITIEVPEICMHIKYLTVLTHFCIKNSQLKDPSCILCEIKGKER